MQNPKSDSTAVPVVLLRGDWPAIFGAEIREWRKERELSVAKLAKLAGVSDRSLAYLEAGTHPPNLETMLRIVGAGFPFEALQRASETALNVTKKKTRARKA